MCVYAYVPCAWCLATGPGVGKGRQIAAAILENFMKGRRKVRAWHGVWRACGCRGL